MTLYSNIQLLGIFTCQSVVGGMPNFSEALVRDNDLSRKASNAASMSSLVYVLPPPVPQPNLISNTSYQNFPS